MFVILIDNHESVSHAHTKMDFILSDIVVPYIMSSFTPQVLPCGYLSFEPNTLLTLRTCEHCEIFSCRM